MLGLPVFNGASSLERALDCLCSQSWKNLDILISDNASDDDTAEVCARAAARDRRIRYVRQGENIGVTANFEFVRRNRRGEFFLWAAHDDERDATFVEKALAALARNPEAVLAHSWTLVERKDGTLELLHWSEVTESLKTFTLAA